MKRTSRFPLRRIVPLLLVVAGTWIACEGDTGPAGPTGPEGPTGEQGPEGSQGPAGMGFGRSAVGGPGPLGECDPEPGGPRIDCVTVALDMPDQGRVLIIAGGGVATDVSGGITFFGGVGCELHVDGSQDALPGGVGVAVGEMNATADPDLVKHTTDATNGFGLTEVTDVLPAGSHAFALACAQIDGDAIVWSPHISAVMLSAM